MTYASHHNIGNYTQFGTDVDLYKQIQIMEFCSYFGKYSHSSLRFVGGSRYFVLSKLSDVRGDLVNDKHLRRVVVDNEIMR